MVYLHMYVPTVHTAVYVLRRVKITGVESSPERTQSSGLTSHMRLGPEVQQHTRLYRCGSVLSIHRNDRLCWLQGLYFPPYCIEGL